MNFIRICVVGVGLLIGVVGGMDGMLIHQSSLGVSYAQVAGATIQSDIAFGVVNNQKIILAVPEGIKAKKAMQAEVDKAQAALNAQRIELETLSKEIEANADLMSAEAKQTKRDELQNKVLLLRDEEMKFQQSIRQKEFAATQGIVEKIALYVKEIAHDKNLTVVFESSQSGVMYIKNYIDITDDVILKFSEKADVSAKSPADAKQNKTKAKEQKQP